LGLSNIQNGRFGLANLPGKYVLGATEQPASYLAATDTLDAIISGEEVDVERKFKDVVTVRSTAKVVWAMNDLPRIGNTTSGTFRRVKVIEFPEPTRRDPRVKERIKGEGAGILNWSLVGFDRLKRRGHFDIPPSVVSATEEFQKDNDIPKLFVEDHCIVGTDRKGDPHKAQASELYDRYKKWCERHGHKPQSATRVAHDWQRLGFEKYQSKGKNYYRGLKLPLADTDSWGR
jgi:putative DNA primase/helicase